MLKIRVKFRKGEEVRFISHLNMTKAFLQALRRSSLPVAYSSGFSPHPKVGFGPPLPLGMKSRSEFADVVLEETIDADEFRTRFNQKLPAGLEILEVREIPLHSRSLTSIIDVATYEVRMNGRRTPLSVSLKLKERVKVNPACAKLRSETAKLSVTPLRLGRTFNGVKEAVKSLLREEEPDPISLDVERTGLFVEREGKFLSPLDV